MTNIWLLSYAVLWLLVATLCLAVLSLARQIGLLHVRLPPSGARMVTPGPDIDSPAPEFETVDLQGRTVRLAQNGAGRERLLLFLSPNCSTCGKLAPAVQSIWRSERRHLDVVLISRNGNQEANAAFAMEHKLTDIPYVISPDLALKYNISITPYAIFVDKGGIVRGKGMVNHLEHLESFLNANELGDPKIDNLPNERPIPARS